MPGLCSFLNLAANFVNSLPKMPLCDIQVPRYGVPERRGCGILRPTFALGSHSIDGRMPSADVLKQSEFPRDPGAARQLNHPSAAISEQELLEGDDVYALESFQIATAPPNPEP